jgi:hypothetical protein
VNLTSTEYLIPSRCRISDDGRSSSLRLLLPLLSLSLHFWLTLWIPYSVYILNFPRTDYYLSFPIWLGGIYYPVLLVPWLPELFMPLWTCLLGVARCFSCWGILMCYQDGQGIWHHAPFLCGCINQNYNRTLHCKHPHREVTVISIFRMRRPYF